MKKLVFLSAFLLLLVPQVLAQPITGSNVKITGGLVAHDAVDSGSPVKVGAKASSTLPAAVASGDRADLTTDLNSRTLVTEIPNGAQLWKSLNATTAQTGVAIWTPASGKKVAIQSCQLGTYGTTSARVILWFGATADTTYTEGTDQTVFKGSFAPSATGMPGASTPPSGPKYSTTTNDVLRITTDAAISIDVVCYGWEF